MCVWRTAARLVKDVYTDVYPSDKQLMTALAPEVQGRLGSFHLVSRITETLRPEHEEFPEACRALSAAIWSMSSSDIARVDAALANGDMITPVCPCNGGLFSKCFLTHCVACAFTCPQPILHQPQVP